jgi:hypothetical protein
MNPKMMKGVSWFMRHPSSMSSGGGVEESLLEELLEHVPSVSNSELPASPQRAVALISK